MVLLTPSESPNNNWGANWPGGLTDPSCPEKEGSVVFLAQVRYAASVAARAFNEKALLLRGAGAGRTTILSLLEAGDRREAFYPRLLGLMCAALKQKRESLGAEPPSCGRGSSSEASTGTTLPKASATSPRTETAKRSWRSSSGVIFSQSRCVF